MLRLARAVGLPAPESAVCTWQTLPATVVHRGILVRIFLEADEELSIGSVELRRDDPGYDPEHKGMHDLARIRRALTALELHAGRPMLEPFAHMLAFDAWIGNVDRHQENWGVLRCGTSVRRLAPVFDVASCLGAELDAQHRLLKQGAELAPYVRGCRSGFGDGAARRPLLLMSSVVEALRSWPEWAGGIKGWLADFASAMDTFPDVVRRVPADWLPADRADFACNLLRTRLDWLRGCSG